MLMMMMMMILFAVVSLWPFYYQSSKTTADRTHRKVDDVTVMSGHGCAGFQILSNGPDSEILFFFFRACKRWLSLKRWCEWGVGRRVFGWWVAPFPFDESSCLMSCDVFVFGGGECGLDLHDLRLEETFFFCGCSFFSSTSSQHSSSLSSLSKVDNFKEAFASFDSKGHGKQIGGVLDCGM